MRLLIVDDEMWSRKLIKNLLQWEEYGITSVEEAEDGKQAIKKLNQTRFDLMITDMRMPGVDGAALLQYIKDSDISIEIIVMSGYEDYKYLHAALKSKAIDYLLKPVDRKDLHKAISIAISKVNKTKTNIYIENILKKEDLKYEINKYHEHKIQLIKAIHNTSEKEIIKNVELIKNDFFTKDINPNFTNYVLLDLKRIITDIEMENNIVVHAESIFYIDTMLERLINISNSLKDKRDRGKISILEVQTYIENNIEGNLTLNDLSEKYYVSKEHLSRLFKKETGLSVQKYIIRKKIDYAKNLLRNHKTISISTIAMMCGYKDIQYFHRIFKKISGVTPLEYRDSNQNSPI